MSAHTYHDQSALFKTTFKQQIQTGMLITLSCGDGSAFSYLVSELALDLTPDSYPTFVENRALYASNGPPQLVMITCTDYNPGRRVWEHRAVLIATPIR